MQFKHKGQAGRENTWSKGPNQARRMCPVTRCRKRVMMQQVLSDVSKPQSGNPTGAGPKLLPGTWVGWGLDGALSPSSGPSMMPYSSSPTDHKSHSKGLLWYLSLLQVLVQQGIGLLLHGHLPGIAGHQLV